MDMVELSIVKVNRSERLLSEIQRILLERPRLVIDHFYLATSITCSNQNKAEDIGHLNICCSNIINPMLLVSFESSRSNQRHSILLKVMHC